MAEGPRREGAIDDYKDLGSCEIVELRTKQALVRVGEQHQVLVPYSLMHEEDIAKLGVDVMLDKLRVQAWFIRKKGIAT